MGKPGPESAGVRLRQKTGTENLRISESQLRLFFDRVDPDERERHVKMRRSAASHAMIEEGERTAALSKLGTQLPELGVEPANREILSDREKSAVRSAIRSYKESEDGSVEYEEMCQAFMRSLRTQKLFRSRFAGWEAQYKEDNPELPPDFRNSPEFQEYIKERGAEFIKENRKLIVEDTVESFVTNNPTEGEEIEDTKVESVSSAINGFVDENYMQLISDDDTVREQTYGKFKELMVAQGYEKVDEIKIKALYEKLVLTVSFQYLSEVEYRALSEKMVENVDVEMTEEDWEEMLNKATEEKYKELEEAVKETPVVTGGGGLSIVTSDGSYNSVEDLGRASGVVFRPVPGEEGTYFVDSDKIEDKQYLPRVRVGSGFFEMEMVFADENASYDGDNLNNHPSKKYRYGNLQEAINRQLLDYQLNVRAKIRQSESVSENPNKIINDQMMQRLAVSLFGFNLNERQLGQDHLRRFTRLCRILMKDNGEPMGSRVEKSLTFMRDRNNASVLWQILESEGQEVHNIDGLIKYGREIRMGNKYNEGGVKI